MLETRSKSIVIVQYNRPNKSHPTVKIFMKQKSLFLTCHYFPQYTFQSLRLFPVFLVRLIS